jgi:putative transcriptional regulator
MLNDSSRSLVAPDSRIRTVNLADEALAYEQGKKRALRVTDVPPPPKPLTATQIRAIRQSFKASQAVFARIINVSPNAVESWEQGVRHPREATLKLLTIAHKHPEILLSGK